ncbi:MAG: T9SS type A sorting domain-containing protein, partial [Bacteroidota bacterium]
SCAKLDVTGAAFDIPSCTDDPPVDTCITDAGSIAPNLDSPVECYDGGECVEIAATVVEAAVLDSGYSVLYVLTSGEELVIQDVSEEPAFCVDSIGIFTIHTLVYDSTTLDLSVIVVGETTGAEVLGLIAEVDTCAKLDVEGAKFEIEDCGACPREAQPRPGALAANPHDCFEGDPLVISAEEVEAPTIPEGYIGVRVLTQGEELTILAVGEDLSYSVADTGIFTIHTLVFDTLTLNLGLLELGLSTAGDLIELAGDTVCFALDVPGAKFMIEECVEDPCIEVDSISAGNLIAVSDTCLEEGGTAKLTAGHEAGPVIPEGYSSIYVLTQGDDLLIVNVADMPMFEVSETGTYRIHTLVYDTLTLDLSIVELGTTTAAQVLDVIGDTICAVLDTEGALFEIESCKESPCDETIDIDPGTLTAVMDSCFDGTNPVMLVAEHEMDPIIPDGYLSTYVLTQGSDLVIIATDSIPSFKVQGLGTYTIHTLVYDPLTLDLGIVEPGITTGGDILTVLDTICAALDVEGAPFDIASCTKVDSCENIKDYILTDWWTERPENRGNHALYLYHSPVDPNFEFLGNRAYQKYIWETEGIYREYFNEDGSMRDTATIKGLVVSWIDPEAKIMIDFKLINPMNWEEFQAMGGDYKANLWSEETADTAHVNWTYWEISDESKLIGQGSLEGLEFAVQHAPENLKFKLQVGYGANDKDASLGLSGWFLYNGEFEGVTYDSQGDINVDIDTCIEAEVCVPIISTNDVEFNIRDFETKPSFEKNPYISINWNAFSSKVDRTTFSVDRSVDGGQLFESIEVVDASSAAFSYSVDDYQVELNRPYIYRVRVVIDGNPVTMTQYEEITLEGINSFRLYPNPANGTMFLISEYPSVGNHTLEMVNAHGQTISTRNLEDLRSEREIDLSNIPAGIYYLKVSAPNGQVELLRFAKY